MNHDDPETYAIIGAGMAVHTELGCGFLEVVYKAALAVELRRRGIPFSREEAFPLSYKAEPLGPLPRRLHLLPVGHRRSQSA